LGLLPFAACHDQEPCPNVGKGLFYLVVFLCMVVRELVLLIDGKPVHLGMGMFGGVGGGEDIEAALRAIARQLKEDNVLQESQGWSLAGAKQYLSSCGSQLIASLAKICHDDQDQSEALAGAVDMMRGLLLSCPDLGEVPRAVMRIIEMLKWGIEGKIRPGNAAGTLSASLTMAHPGGKYDTLRSLNVRELTKRTLASSSAVGLFARQQGVESLQDWLSPDGAARLQGISDSHLIRQLCEKALQVETSRLKKASNSGPTCPWLYNRLKTLIRVSCSPLCLVEGVVVCTENDASSAPCAHPGCLSPSTFMVGNKCLCSLHISHGASWSPAQLDTAQELVELVVDAMMAKFERMVPGETWPMPNVLESIGGQVLEGQRALPFGLEGLTSKLIEDVFFQYKSGNDGGHTTRVFPEGIKIVRSKGVAVEFTMEMPKLCTHAGCRRPTESRRFYQIGEHTKAGGRDWRKLAGSVLCYSCYERFRTRGTLERTRNKPLVGSARRCTYEHCDNPADSGKFYQIEEGKTTAGRDWSLLVGQVLCGKCYKRFRGSGTLKRAYRKNQKT